MGLETRVGGVQRGGHAVAKEGRTDRWGHEYVVGHLVERRVGSEAVGGGGGPRRSKSSM